jgi:hypothetical protein
MQPWLSFRIAAIDRQHPGAVTSKADGSADEPGVGPLPN